MFRGFYRFFGFCGWSVGLIRNEKVKEDWQESYVINIYEGKGETLLKGNCKDPKLQRQNVIFIVRQSK